MKITMKTGSSFVAAIALGFSLPQIALAQSTESLSGLFACESMNNKDAQLACFLTETAKLKGVAAEEPRDLVVVEKEVAEEIKTRKAEEKIKAAKSRTLTIRSTANIGNRIRFTLENGEVWQQVEAERVKLGRGNPDTLTIKKRAFGSFLGQVNGKRPSFRVRQVE